MNLDEYMSSVEMTLYNYRLVSIIIYTYIYIYSSIVTGNLFKVIYVMTLYDCLRTNTSLRGVSMSCRTDVYRVPALESYLQGALKLKSTSGGRKYEIDDWRRREREREREKERTSPDEVLESRNTRHQSM